VPFPSCLDEPDYAFIGLMLEEFDEDPTDVKFQQQAIKALKAGYDNL
jgi:hypothetical protein